MVNTLAGKAGLKLGPVLLETLVKHYFERLGHEHDEKTKLQTTQLRKDELLYDEAFNVVKTFLDASSKHTVEELQNFSNARTPSPPWVYVVRLVVPMSCCDDAATFLIEALGGEEVCKRVIGGTKWWQVRGIRGVDAEWITARKDWQEAKRKYKAQQRKESKEMSTGEAGTASVPETPPVEGKDDESEAGYSPDMDEMRCVLWSHGGGYYFGSVDQERYAIQRFARKINGRVFAVNYRLAPQYPFPCAIQDLLAAYLFLIRPPLGASHRPVKPAHIIFAGDSAGGGLTLALLQVVRDCGLPAPAGGVLISPWCDLTHSFPSIHINTATDVIPQYGLSMHKPSTLWPPPSDELTSTVQSTLRSRIRQLARLDPPSALTSPSTLHITPSGLVVGTAHGASTQSVNSVHTANPDASTGPSASSAAISKTLPTDGEPIALGTTAPLPTATAADSPRATATSVPSQGSASKIKLVAENGDLLEIDKQIQLYTPNDLLTHPLVSGAMGFLGGLPPLLIVAGDKEVLRDEAIYTAHKAAHPEQYPIREEQREMYPALKGIEDKYGPTKVHLQLYDDSAHVLPILFAFTTPAKFCYRAIASFCKHVTGMRPTMLPHMPQSAPPGMTSFAANMPTNGGPFGLRIDRARESMRRRSSFRFLSGNSTSPSGPEDGNGEGGVSEDSLLGRPHARRSVSASMSSIMRRASHQRRPRTSAEDRPLMPSLVSEEPTEDGLLQPSPRAVTASATLQGFPEMHRVDSAELAEPFTPSATVSEFQEAPLVGDLPAVPATAPASVPTFQQAGQIAPAQTSKESIALAAPKPGVTTVLSGQLVDTPPQSPPRSPPESHPASPLGSPRMRQEQSGSSDVAGPRFNAGETPPLPPGARNAGDPIVYADIDGVSPWIDNMIRERVSTQGVVRPLEAEGDLVALKLPPELIGVVSERAARRYLDGCARFEKKFKHQIKQIAKQRRKNLERARRDTVRSLPQLQAALLQDGGGEGANAGASASTDVNNSARKDKGKGRAIGDGLFSASAGSWGWAWALDEAERPPPSSIVARRDTEEARRLARIADTRGSAAESSMSGNSLWGLMMTFLTVAPDNSASGREKEGEDMYGKEDRATEENGGKSAGPSKRRFTLPKLFLDKKGATANT